MYRPCTCLAYGRTALRPCCPLQLGSDEIDDDGLARALGALEHLPGDIRSGGLGDEDQHLCVRVGREGVERIQHRDPSHPRVQVVASRPDSLGNAAAPLVDQRRDLLQPGARGADQANVSPPHHVGKAEGNAVHDRRPTVGSHDQ